MILSIVPGRGPSHIDLYDLKPAAPAKIRGEFRPIETMVPGLEMSELLPEQARIADKFALILLCTSSRLLNTDRIRDSFGSDRQH